MSNVNVGKFTSKFLTVSSTSEGASADVLYTCPNNYIALVRYLHISAGGAQKKITIEYYDSASNSYDHLTHDFIPDANTIHDVIPGGAYLVLHAGDKLVCSREASGIFDVTCSVEELYDPAR
jgi:hypothetical protein